MADLRRLAELGMVPPLAKEVAAQITAGVGDKRRLAELSMVPRLASEVATQISSKTTSAMRLAELSMPPSLANEVVNQINSGFDPNILFLDDFETNPGPLSGRTAQVGGLHYPSSNGDIVARMVVAGGVMKQNSTGTGAGYDNALLSENPGSLTCDFIWGSGSQPAVMGIYPYPGSGNPNVLTSNKLIHLFMTTTNLVPQMGDSTYFPNANANYPMAWPGPASPFSLTIGQKYTLTGKVQGKWVFMELFNSSSTSIAKAQAYDSKIPGLMGRSVFVAETFDNLMSYDKVQAMKASAFTVPTIAPAIDSYFPTGLDGLTGSMYAGGGVAWNSAGSVTLTANATLGSGGAVPIGAIATGDRVRVCVDVVSVGANGWVAAIAPTSPGSPISAVTNFFTAAGRAVLDLVATGSDANSSLVIGGNGVGATTANIKGLFILKNGPTTFV